MRMSAKGWLGAALFSIGLAAAPSASAVGVGFQGEFWDAGSLSNLDAALAVIDSRSADATFTSSVIDYPRGSGGSITDNTALSTYLADDAASLIGAPDIGDVKLGGSIFRFTGFLDLTEARNTFKVGSDDGFRLTLGDPGTPLFTMAHTGQRGFRSTTQTATLSGLVAVELIYFENAGRTGVEFRVNDVFASGAAAPQQTQPSAVPIPATLPLLLGGLGFGAIWLRRRKAA